MLDPRRAAGLLAAPGCRRRQAVDAAMIDSATLARVTGSSPGGRSPYAHERNGTFTQLALADLPNLVSSRLSVHCGPVREDIGLAGALYGDDGLYLLRYLTLPLGGRRLHIDQLVLLRAPEAVHVVEIRSYASLDGQADPAKVAGTARELAAVVLALRDQTSQDGQTPELITSRALLVLPRNFGLSPVGSILDIAPQLRRLSLALRQLDEAPVLDFDDPSELPALLERIEARFGDGCPQCPLFEYCGDSIARSNSPARAGSTVVNVCGPVDTVDRALALAHGEIEPDGDAERAIAAELARAATAQAWAGRFNG